MVKPDPFDPSDYDLRRSIKWETPEVAPKRPNPGDRFFGCPIRWLRLVYPVAKSKGELVVAIYLWRLRMVTKSRTVTMSNDWLNEIGVTRKVKYRALIRLEEAKLIKIERRGRAAARVTLLFPR